MKSGRRSAGWAAIRSGAVRQWTLFRLACQMLTRIPAARNIDYSPGLDAASVRYYPAVGMAVGLAGGAVFAVAHGPLGAFVAALLAVAATALATGALHEDGLADTMDGLGGGRSAERTLEIMRDSHIGVYGVLALVLAVAVKVSALAALPLWTGFCLLVAAHGLSRWSMLLVIATARYVRTSGTASPVAGPVSPAAHGIAGAAALACLALVAAAAGLPAALGVLAGLACGHVAIRAVFQRRLGGYTGDTLGATQQFGEIGACLGLLACL